MKKSIAVMTVLLLVVILNSPSFAQRGRGWERPGEGRSGEERGGAPGWGDQREERGKVERGQAREGMIVPDFMLMDLDVTPDQASNMNALRNAYIKDITSLRGRVSGKEKEMKQLREERPDLDELIQAMQKEIFNLKKGVQEKRHKYVQDVRDILTPEQNAVLRSQGVNDDDSKKKMGPGRGSGPEDPDRGMDRRRNW